MTRIRVLTWGIALLACLGPRGFSQLRPENVLVVIDVQRRDSIEVGSYYVKRRGIPPENVVRVYARTKHRQTGWGTFERRIHGPVLKHIREKGLERRIHMIVLTHGMPYDVEREAATWMFFAGGPRMAKRNPYYMSERPLDAAHDLGPGRYAAMMITGFTREDALALIDRGVASDGTRPPGTVYLLRGSGPRGRRYTQFPEVAAELGRMGVRCRLLGGVSIEDKPDVLGYLTGATGVKTKNLYRPGAFAEHMTSSGGQIYNRHDQMSILEFVAAGASGTCGTVYEPLADTRKFPHAAFYALYARGFTLGEALWQSLATPHQVIMIGDPLACPFKRKPPVVEALAAEGRGPGRLLLRVKVDPGEADGTIEQVTCSLGKGRPRAVFPKPRSDTRVTLSFTRRGEGINVVAVLGRDESAADVYVRLADQVGRLPDFPVKAVAGKQALRLTCPPGTPVLPFVRVQCDALGGGVASWIPEASAGRFSGLSGAEPAQAVMFLCGKAKREDAMSLKIGRVERSVTVPKETDARAALQLLIDAFADDARIAGAEGLSLTTAAGGRGYTRLLVRSKQAGPAWNGTDVTLRLSRSLGFAFFPYERTVKVLGGTEPQEGTFDLELVPNPLTAAGAVALTIGETPVRLEPRRNVPADEWLSVWAHAIRQASPEVSVTLHRRRLVLRTKAEQPPALSVNNPDDGAQVRVLGGGWAKLPSFPVGKDDRAPDAEWVAFLDVRVGKTGPVQIERVLNIAPLKPGRHTVNVTAVFGGPIPTTVSASREVVVE